MAHQHTIHNQHLGWNNDFTPVRRIAGRVGGVRIFEASGGQLSPVDGGGCRTLDFGKVNPVTGPFSSTAPSRATC